MERSAAFAACMGSVSWPRSGRSRLQAATSFIRVRSRNWLRNGSGAVTTIAMSVFVAAVLAFSAPTRATRSMRPLRYILAPHVLEHMPHHTQEHCDFEARPGQGDERIDLTHTAGPWTEALSTRGTGNSLSRRVGDTVARLAENYLAR